MRIIHRRHPHLHSGDLCTNRHGDLCTNRHAVPSIQLIFIRIERNICPGTVRIDMPHVFNHFVLHTLILPARYCDLSVFAKRETDKKEKPFPEAYNAVFGETVSTKIKEKRVKRQRGKDAEYTRARFRPHTTRIVADPLYGTRGWPRFIAQGIIIVPDRFGRFPVKPGMTPCYSPFRYLSQKALFSAWKWAPW